MHEIEHSNISSASVFLLRKLIDEGTFFISAENLLWFAMLVDEVYNSPISAAGMFLLRYLPMLMNEADSFLLSLQ